MPIAIEKERDRSKRGLRGKCQHSLVLMMITSEGNKAPTTAAASPLLRAASFRGMRIAAENLRRLAAASESEVALSRSEGEPLVRENFPNWFCFAKTAYLSI